MQDTLSQVNLIMIPQITNESDFDTSCDGEIIDGTILSLRSFLLDFELILSIINPAWKK